MLGAPAAALIFIAFLHGGSMFMSNYLLGKTTQSVRASCAARSSQKAPALACRHLSGLSHGSRHLEVHLRIKRGAFERSQVEHHSRARHLPGGRARVRASLEQLDARPREPPARAPDRQASAIRSCPSRVKVLMKHCQESFAEALGRIKQVYDGHRLVKLSDTLRVRNSGASRQHQRHDAQDAARNDEGLLARNAAHAGDLHVGRRRRAGLRHVPDEPRAPDDG